jgi:hypothetical protein
MPQSGYEEIGVLDNKGGGVACNISDFKEAIAAKVCEVGGDLAVGQVNGAGCYVSGSVFRKTDSAPPADAEPVK